MRGQQGVNTFCDAFDHRFGFGVVTRAHPDDGQNDGEQVLDPVVQFLGQQIGTVPCFTKLHCLLRFHFGLRGTHCQPVTDYKGDYQQQHHPCQQGQNLRFCAGCVIGSRGQDPVFYLLHFAGGAPQPVHQ